LKDAAALQLEVPFRWLLGLASEANLDETIELMVEDRLVGALCEIEATGFDLTRTRPARALAGWSRTMSLAATSTLSLPSVPVSNVLTVLWSKVLTRLGSMFRAIIPTPSLPSVPASALLAWHLCTLRDWQITCDGAKALANGRVVWADPEPRIDFCSWMKASAKRVLFLAQTRSDGVVFGFFANCPLSGEGGGRDPALKSAIFVLEHPTGEQRKWQVQVPNYDVILNGQDALLGAGLYIAASGWMSMGPAPEFGMTEVDASFITPRPAVDHGWSWAQIVHWELWSV
jgi:hypothetical protein